MNRVKSEYSLFMKFLHFPKDSDDYRALLEEYDEIVNQLTAARQETITVREQGEKFRRENTTSTTRFELESQKREVTRLTQLVENLRTDLEKTKKENSEVRALLAQYCTMQINKDTCSKLYRDSVLDIVVIY